MCPFLHDPSAGKHHDPVRQCSHTHAVGYKDYRLPLRHLKVFAEYLRLRQRILIAVNGTGNGQLLLLSPGELRPSGLFSQKGAAVRLLKADKIQRFPDPLILPHMSSITEMHVVPRRKGQVPRRILA